MKTKEQKKKETKAFFKEILRDLKDSILFEIVWNILMFIPRMIFRFIKEIW